MSCIYGRWPRIGLVCTSRVCALALTFALGCTQVEDSIGRGSQTDASKNSAEAPSLQVFHKHLPEPSSNGVERAQDSSGDISSADIMRVENMAKIVRDGVGDVATVGRAGIAHEMDAGTRTQRKSLKAWQKQHAAAEHAVRDDMHDLWSQ